MQFPHSSADQCGCFYPTLDWNFLMGSEQLLQQKLSCKLTTRVIKSYTNLLYLTSSLTRGMARYFTIWLTRVLGRRNIRGRNNNSKDRGTFSLNENILNNDLFGKPQKQQMCSLFNNCFLLEFCTHTPWRFNAVQMSVPWTRPVATCPVTAESTTESLQVTQTCRELVLLTTLLIWHFLHPCHLFLWEGSEGQRGNKMVSKWSVKRYAYSPLKTTCLLV